MSKQLTDLSKLVTEHIQSLDPYAEVILLFPPEEDFKEEPQVYVLTPGKVDISLEHQYLNACYQVELKSGQSLSLYIYSKEEWYKQFIDTPIYKKVHTEGIHL
ncbi:MAG: hypothetical protein JEZ14_19045 [Marinilabiliaceae bacterium]|nr:hypothetical protein [Marinilabiliaceae bacterium]